MPSNDTGETPTTPTKFQPGQTVYRVDKGRYSGYYAVPSWGDDRYQFTKATIRTARWERFRTGYGAKHKFTFRERVTLEGSYRAVPADRAHVITEEMFEAIRPEYEAAKNTVEAIAAELERKRHEVLRAFIAFAGSQPDEAFVVLARAGGIRLIMSFGGTLTGVCTQCWQEHKSYVTYDHEPELVK